MLAFCSVPVIGWVVRVLTIAGVGAMTLQVGGRADVLRPQEDEVGFRREPTFRF